MIDRNMSILQGNHSLSKFLKFTYYSILTDKRCSESSSSLDQMGIDGMLELYEMLCAKDALEAVMSENPKDNGRR